MRKDSKEDSIKRYSPVAGVKSISCSPRRNASSSSLHNARGSLGGQSTLAGNRIAHWHTHARTYAHWHTHPRARIRQLRYVSVAMRENTWNTVIGGSSEIAAHHHHHHHHHHHYRHRHHRRQSPATRRDESIWIFRITVTRDFISFSSHGALRSASAPRSLAPIVRSSCADADDDAATRCIGDGTKPRANCSRTAYVTVVKGLRDAMRILQKIMPFHGVHVEAA